MGAAPLRTPLPILMLYNLDPAWESEALDAVKLQSDQLQSELQTLGHSVAALPVRDRDLQACLTDFDPKETLVFNWCEELPGVPRSEALVAQALEAQGFAYTGADPAVLALAWHKPLVKALLEAQDIPIPAWQLCPTPDVHNWKRFPAIVKPAMEHCSLGVSVDAVVLNENELRDRVAFVLESFDGPAMVEDFIDGREFHVSLWGNGETSLLPPAEMDFAAFDNVRDRLCTYDSKFTPGSEHYEEIQVRLPADLTDAESANLAAVSQAAYHAVGCRDYGRLDIRLRDNTFFVLDVNPNADLSADSSMACAAEVEGYSHADMVSRLVQLASARHPTLGHPPAE
jgi:D-alanine-D-alanine ligase